MLTLLRSRLTPFIIVFFVCGAVSIVLHVSARGSIVDEGISLKLLCAIVLIFVTAYLFRFFDSGIAGMLRRIHIFRDPLIVQRNTQAEHLEHLHRFAEFGKMSSGFFHDLMTPLTTMSLHIEQLHTLSMHGATATTQKLDEVLLATRRMAGLVRVVRRQLESRGAPELFDISETIRTALSVLAYKANESLVTIRFTGVQKLAYFGYAAKLYQVVLNLVSNALDAVVDGRCGMRAITVSLRHDDEHILLTVRDTGSGIPSELVSKIFEPFFTTKSSSHGLGIGLAITKEIVERDFMGTIAVASTEGKGSVFTVTIPTSLSVL